MLDHLKLAAAAGMSVCIWSAALEAAASDIADAVMRRDADRMRVLVGQNADVNAPQADGTTALHWAARWDDLEAARLLVRSGADVAALNRAGITALHLAATNGSAGMIRILLDAGADANSTLSGGETALMTAANAGAADAVRLLLDHGARLDARERIKGETALMWASAENHSDVVRMLLDHGADINACTNIDLVNTARGFIVSDAGVPSLPCVDGRASAQPEPEREPGNAQGRGGRGRGGGRPPGPPLGGSGGGGMTPLLFAVRQGHVETVRVLLEAGADIDQTMADGTSAMVVAIINGEYRLASELLSRGADPNIGDMRGRAALYAAVDMRNYRWSELPKPPGDGMEPLALIRELLDYGVDTNLQLTAAIPYRGPSNFSNIFESMVGATPFLRAAESGDIVVMRLLLEYGADPFVTTGDNKTALMLASGVGYSDGTTFEWSERETLEAIELCLDVGLDVNAVSDRGMTALLGAAHRGSNSIVRLLAERGADLGARDAQGRSALDWARGVVVIDQRPARPQPHTVAFLEELMSAAVDRR